MLKNNIKLDIKVKSIEENTTQAQVAEDIGTSASYMSRIVNGGDKAIRRSAISSPLPGGLGAFTHYPLEACAARRTINEPALWCAGS